MVLSLSLIRVFLICRIQLDVLLLIIDCCRHCVVVARLLLTIVNDVVAMFLMQVLLIEILMMLGHVIRCNVVARLLLLVVT